MPDNFSRYFSMYRDLPRNAYLLAFTNFINGSGYFVFPFLVLLLTQKLDYSSTEAGTTMFITAAAYLPGSLLGGSLADRVGRKALFLTSRSVIAVSWLLCGFFPYSEAIVLLIAIAYFSLGVYTPIHRALEADISNPDNRKAIYSLIYLCRNIGFSISPVAAGLLFENFANWLFWGNGLCILATILLIYLFLDETKPDNEEKPHTPLEAAESGSVWSVILARPNLFLFAAAGILSAFIYAQVFFSLPLQLVYVYDQEGAALYGRLMGFNGLVIILFTAPVIVMTKNLSPAVSIAAGVFLFAAGFSQLGNTQWLPLFFIAALVFTLGEILERTNVGIYIANHSPMSHRARINSIIPLLIGAGTALAPLLTGWFIDHYGVSAVWPGIAALGVISGVLFLLLAVADNRSSRSESDIDCT